MYSVSKLFVLIFLGEKKVYYDSLVKETCNTVANALELRLFCINADLCFLQFPNIEMSQVVEILPHGRQAPIHHK